MLLINDWRRIIRKAWSFRLLVLAGVLSGAEVILPYFGDTIPRWVFTGLSFVVTCGALVARVVAQPKMHDDGA